ncbi:MAG: hypothetical protein ACOCXQ_02755 [Patescibacteria group bacterium]
MGRGPLSRRSKRTVSPEEAAGIEMTNRIAQVLIVNRGTEVTEWFTEIDEEGYFFTIDQIVAFMFLDDPPEHRQVLKNAVSLAAEILLGEARYTQIVRERWRKNLDRNMGGRGSPKHRATSRKAGKNVLDKYGRVFFVKIAGHIPWVTEEIDMAMRLAGEYRTSHNLRDNVAIAIKLNQIFHDDQPIRSARSVAALYADIRSGKRRGIE